MEVQIQIERAAEALNDDDAPGAAAANACVARPVLDLPEHRLRDRVRAISEGRLANGVRLA